MRDPKNFLFSIFFAVCFSAGRRCYYAQFAPFRWEFEFDSPVNGPAAVRCGPFYFAVLPTNGNEP